MKEIILSKRLKELRKEKGLTGLEVSKQIGYNRSTLTQWETNRNRPSYEALWALADFYDVTIDYLVGRSEI